MPGRPQSSWLWRSRFSRQQATRSNSTVIVIGQRSITDWITAAMALVTIAILWRFKKIPEPAIVLAAALIGLVVKPLITHA
jgi:chromate transport protein ChrA